MEVISYYCKNDELAKDIRGYRTYPRLMQVIENYQVSYDLIIMDPAWSFAKFHDSGTPYEG